MSQRDNAQRDSDAITPVAVVASVPLRRFITPVAVFFIVILVGMTGYLLIQPDLPCSTRSTWPSSPSQPWGIEKSVS